MYIPESELLWCGLPSEPDYFGSLQKNLQINIKPPYFIWTGNGAIPVLLEKVFSKTDIEYFNVNGSTIYLLEPLLLRLNGEYNYSYYCELFDSSSNFAVINI